eukprot:evm.model.NODE_8668_length_1666_cov_11.953781.1
MEGTKEGRKEGGGKGEREGKSYLCEECHKGRRLALGYNADRNGLESRGNASGRAKPLGREGGRE